ncbi:MAG TPA: ester cyclase [Ktedonobacterales bacterium]
MAMVTQDNKALVNRYIDEVFNNRNLAAIDEFLSPDLVDHTLPPSLPQNIVGTKQAVIMFLNAFPDLRITVDEAIAEGDRVAVRYTSHGTQRGSFAGIPPMGREITVQSYISARIADGKIVEMWGLDDQVGLLRQLGVIPAMFGFVFFAGLGAGIGLSVLLGKVFTSIANTRSTRTNVA